MIDFVLTGLQWFCYLYTTYVILFGIKNYYDWRNWSPFIRHPMMVFFLIGYILDIVWNIVFASVFLLQLPIKDKDQTFSKRLNYIHDTHRPDHWRVKIADFIGVCMLNIADKDHYRGEI